MNQANLNRSRSSLLLWPTCLALAAMVAGCSKEQYRNQADREVYGIIQSVENQIFGSTNEFSIDTTWSERDPDSILAPEIIESRLATNRLHLTLELALDLAANQSRRYQTEKERLYLAALTLTGERYEFGPQFFGNAGAGVAGTSQDTEAFADYNAGMNQALKTGGSFAVTVANDLLRYYTGNARNDTVNFLSVNFAQPLLRGFGKNSPSVERLTQAERNIVYTVRSYSFFQRSFAIEIVNDYFTLLGQKNVIHNNYSNYISQAESTRRLEARSRDRETINQVDLARQSELSAKNAYVNSIASYFNSLDSFKNKLTIPLNVRITLDDSELEKLAGIGLIPVNLDKDAAFRLATQRQLEVLNSIDRFEDQKRKIKVAADQLRADLRIFGNAQMNSDSMDYSDFDIDNVRYNVGLELNLPIDRLRERNNYRATLVNFEAELRNLALELDTLKDQIDRGMRTLEQRRQNYLIQQNAFDLASRRVLSTQLRLEAGLAEVRDLVEAQNDQIDAQNSVTAALVSYQNERLQLLLNIGVVDTQPSEFWFLSHLEKTPELLARDTVPLDLPRGELIPPDQVFNN